MVLMMSRFKLISAFFVCMFSMVPLHAQIVIWDGSEGNDILDPLNWTPATAPTDGTTTGQINSTTGTLSSSSQTHNDLIIVQNTGIFSKGANNTFDDTSWTLNNSGTQFNHGGGRLRFRGASTEVTINGGSLATTTQLDLNSAGTRITMLGGGSVSSNTLTGGGYVDWISSSTATMTVATEIVGGTEWAQTMYETGRLRYDGDDNTTLGLSWTQVTSGGTQIWDYNAGTDTLALIPEPSSIALIGIAGITLMIWRRRR